MSHLGPERMILGMTSRPTSSKVLLVADARLGTNARTALPLRRFRLARLRLEGRPTTGAARFDHLKRVYD
jgi:hypothetical protein